MIKLYIKNNASEQNQSVIFLSIGSKVLTTFLLDKPSQNQSSVDTFLHSQHVIT